MRACVPQPITPSVRASRRARYFAATALAAPVRSWPSASASITAFVSAALEEHDDEGGAVAGRRVRLHARQPALAVDGRHHGERAAVEPDAVARHVLDLAGGEPAERVLDRLDRVRGREQPGDVGLGELKGQARSLGRLRPCVGPYMAHVRRALRGRPYRSRAVDEALGSRSG